MLVYKIGDQLLKHDDCLCGRREEPFSVRIVTTGTTVGIHIAGADNLTISWGDGGSDTYTVGVTPGQVVYHSYVAGTYDISFISGTVVNIEFGGKAGTTPALLRAVLTKVPGWLGLIDATQLFCFCEQITSWKANFFDAACGNVTSLSLMFKDDDGFSDFNEDVSGWNTSKVTSMYGTFYKCGDFDQDLSTWDVTALTNAFFMLDGSGFTQTNYDKLLVSWAAQNVHDSVNFHAGTAKYGAGAPATARAHLVDDHGWTITDSGPA